MTFQQISTAARTCAGYAAAAGWANNGTYSGNLVTAVAVCVAESGGNPAIYYCDGDGTVATYPPVTCPGGSDDRGLWQVNSKAWPKAQQWTVAGDTLRGGTSCLTAGSGQPAVTVSTCSGDASQAWTVQGTGQLKNAQTGLCLRDARGNHPAGAPLALAPCQHTRAKTWWLP